MSLATLPNVSGTTRPFSTAHAALDALRIHLRGDLILEDHPEYDTARRTVSIVVDRRPMAIVRAADAHDVAQAVVFARTHNLPLTVRSGGHGLAYEKSVIDDGLMIDLTRMDKITITPETRIAHVQPGANSGDLGPLAAQSGLALSTGDTHSVGFGGLTTGGGVGFMVRKHGLAIDNLLAAEVVTADGEIVTASAHQHPDLFWAIRGGGGNFGIVTEFVFRLASVPQILGGMLVLPATRETMRGYLDYTATAPDDLTTLADLSYAPPAPHVPAEMVGKLVFNIYVCWSGDLDAGEAAVAPLRALATPIADLLTPMPYHEIYKLTAHQAEPHAVAIRMMFADELSDATLDAALEAMQKPSSPYSLFHLRGLGGAFAQVPEDVTAFAHRKHPYFVAVIGLWLDASEDRAKHEAWTNALWEQIRHERRGVYVNFLQDEGPERVREAYPGETWERLAAIKKRYDPTNLFRFNQNVPPGGAESDVIRRLTR